MKKVPFEQLSEARIKQITLKATKKELKELILMAKHEIREWEEFIISCELKLSSLKAVNK